MALKLASRAYLLESGQIISQGDAAEVASNDYSKGSHLGGRGSSVKNFFVNWRHMVVDDCGYGYLNGFILIKRRIERLK